MNLEKDTPLAWKDFKEWLNKKYGGHSLRIAGWWTVFIPALFEKLPDSWQLGVYAEYLNERLPEADIRILSIVFKDNLIGEAFSILNKNLKSEK